MRLRNDTKLQDSEVVIETVNDIIEESPNVRTCFHGVKKKYIVPKRVRMQSKRFKISLKNEDNLSYLL